MTFACARKAVQISEWECGYVVQEALTDYTPTPKVHVPCPF